MNKALIGNFDEEPPSKIPPIKTSSRTSRSFRVSGNGLRLAFLLFQGLPRMAVSHNHLGSFVSN